MEITSKLKTIMEAKIINQAITPMMIQIPDGGTGAMVLTKRIWKTTVDSLNGEETPWTVSKILTLSSNARKPMSG